MEVLVDLFISCLVVALNGFVSNLSVLHPLSDMTLLTFLFIWFSTDATYYWKAVNTQPLD